MELINYAELTWPEVAELPRQVPVLIPLGLEPFDLNALGAQLDAPEVVVMPAIPYGFPQKDNADLGALAVGKGMLRRVLRGIQRGLHAQGFEEVSFLDGSGIGRSWTHPGVTLLPAATLQPPVREIPWRWPGDLERRVVVVSTGHTEQHGYHLPLSTDTVIAQAIVDRLSTAAAEEVCCLPVWPYGVSTHTRQFPGTLDIGGRTFEDLFLGVTCRLVHLGARLIYFSNTHGGNHSHIVNVVKRAGERCPEAFTVSEWLHTTGPELARFRQSALGGMGHGGELETSYLLHLRPDLVHMGRAVVETDFISTPNFYLDWVEGGRMIANPPWTDDTRSGVYGDPTLATAEKGRRWLEAAVQEKRCLFEEMGEQFQRRRVRRALRGAPGSS